MDKVFEAVPAAVDMEKIGNALLGNAMLAEIDVEKVREAASAHYKDLTEDQKKAAQSFFELMDKDKNSKISVDEFMTFLSFAGFETEKHEWLFKELDKDNNGTLDFQELVTFFYVLSRDEYKNLLDRRPSTDLPGQQAKTGRRTARANDQGQQLNMSEFSEHYEKLKGVYRLGQWVNENCSIM